MPGGFVATLVSVELPVGAREGRHLHSGTLVAYVTEGALTLDYEGKPTVTYKTGETFSVEPGKVHEGMNKGSVPTTIDRDVRVSERPAHDDAGEMRK